MKPECKFYIVKNGVETEISQLTQEDRISLDIAAIKGILKEEGVEVIKITPIYKNIL